MPTYEYELVNRRTGAVVARAAAALPVEERDDVKLRRVPVPRGIVIAGAAQDPCEQSHQVLTAYRRAEVRHGSNGEFFRRIGHTPEQIKRVWAED